MENLSEEIYDKLLSFREVVSNAKKNKDELFKELSNLDLEINDIYHYIEFSDCSVTDMVRLHYVLKDVLEKRRKVKNTISVLACLMPEFTCTKGVVLKKLSTFEENENKCYIVRTDILTKALGESAPRKDSKFFSSTKGEE